jgi:hypothetical protein
MDEILMKPLDRERLAEALARARNTVNTDRRVVKAV